MLTKINAQITQLITINNGDALLDNAIELDVFSNMTAVSDETTILNIETDIENGARFSTDINGMYFLKRNFNK